MTMVIYIMCSLIKDMKEMVLIDRYKVIALFGKSGAGKDSIQKWLVENRPDLNGIVSYTTRPPRDKEIEGVDYHFISQSKFDEMCIMGDMLETANFRGWWYGTPKSALDKDKINIGVFNIEGIRQILKKPELVVLPVEVYTDDSERLCRCLERELEPDCKEICRRFLTDEDDFKQIDFFALKYRNYFKRDFSDIMDLIDQTNFIEGRI